MLTTKSLAIAIGFCALSWTGHACADEFTDSLALLKRAMAGHWAGQLTGTDNAGRKFEDDDAFTYVVTSEDGLDSATWSAGSLEIAKHEGAGRYVLRSWNRAGRRNETELRVRIADDPDAAGNGTWVLELEQRAADGGVMETHERFTLADNTLQMSIEMRPAGSERPFETMVTGVWSRSPRR